ncbi:MAG: hypothetical protein AAGJ40_02220 [Planctomycetota bacterium]
MNRGPAFRLVPDSGDKGGITAIELAYPNARVTDAYPSDSVTTRAAANASNRSGRTHFVWMLA